MIAYSEDKQRLFHGIHTNCEYLLLFDHRDLSEKDFPHVPKK